MKTGVKSQTPEVNPATATAPTLKPLSAVSPVRNETGKIVLKAVGVTVTWIKRVSPSFAAFCVDVTGSPSLAGRLLRKHQEMLPALLQLAVPPGWPAVSVVTPAVEK